MTISATVIADSINADGKRLTTLQLRYPRFIHAEFMTHRVMSRGASSSRAIPVKRLIEDVKNDPVAPSFWGANQKGMQARAELDQNDKAYAEQVWDYARSEAITAARCLADVGAHKQIVNRILEPFSHINVVVTATEWDNFFNLRIHSDAQPEIHKLAIEMRDAMRGSEPQLLELGVWHLPYILDEEHYHYDEDSLIKASVARCARVSYKTHDGLPTTVEQDIDLYYKLVGSVPLHASPAEHQATPDMTLERADGSEYWLHREKHGNLVGWIQYRKLLEEEFEVAADLEKV